MLTKEKTDVTHITANWQPEHTSRIQNSAAMVSQYDHWCDRQMQWFKRPLSLTQADKALLKKSGSIRDTFNFDNITKIISAWLSDDAYPFEQRIDYRIDPTATLTSLGLVSIHLERSQDNRFRLGIECCSPDHYANLHALLEDENLPTSSMCHWAMQPYYLYFTEQEIFTAIRLLKLLENNSTAKLNCIWADLRSVLIPA